MSRILLNYLLAILISGMAFKLEAQGTAFFYQGQLTDGGAAANGNFDMEFSLYDAPTNGNLISGPISRISVSVANGLFTTNIDFGAVFTGTNYWLAIGVRTNGSTNAFTSLEPLQPLLPVPYSIFANSSSNLLGTLGSAQLSGTYSAPVSFSNPGNSISGSFSGAYAGNGSGLTSLNGSQVTSGTVADARLSANVALLNGNQKFTGSNFFTSANLFTNRSNTFIGNFFGNGLVGWIPVSVTTTQAMPDAGYLLLSPSLTTVTLPPTVSLLTGDIVRISGGGSGGWQVAQNAGQSIVGNFSDYSQTTWLPANIASATWIGMGSSASGSLMAAVPTASGQVYLSTDYGYDWSPSGSPNSLWRCVAVSADGSRLIAGQESGGSLFYSTNFGSSWAPGLAAVSTNWASIAMSANGMNDVAVANPSGIYTSSNGGATWQLQLAGAAGWTSVASSANGSNLVAVASSGLVYTSSNSGGSWTPRTAGSGGLDFTGVASSADGTKLVAVSYGGGIFTSANSGANWQPTSASPVGYEGVTSSSDGAKLAAVDFGGPIYTSINFGSTWTNQSALSLNWASICGSADGSHLAAAVNNGDIYYSSSSTLTSTTVGVNGYLAGPQFSAVELQYLGNGQFMPISSTGSFWGN
jgi:hypothetical protein